MTKKQNNTNKPNNTTQSTNVNQSLNTISQNIFVKPIISSETKGANLTGVKMRMLTENVDMQHHSYTKVNED